jgi:hypothetical protein
MKRRLCKGLQHGFVINLSGDLWQLQRNDTSKLLTVRFLCTNILGMVKNLFGAVSEFESPALFWRLTERETENLAGPSCFVGVDVEDTIAEYEIPDAAVNLGRQQK